MHCIMYHNAMSSSKTAFCRDVIGCLASSIILYIEANTEALNFNHIMYSIIIEEKQNCTCLHWFKLVDVSNNLFLCCDVA